jgi:hypothetical protein
MRRSKLVRRTTLGMAAWALSACYSYVAAPAAGLRVGEHVRIRVSGAEAERLEPTLSLNGRLLEGELLEQGDSSIALGVALSLPPSSAVLPDHAEQRVLIPRADLQDVELRRLDKLRTSLLVGGAVAAVAGIAVARGSSLLGGSGATGTPNERRVPSGIPLLRLRLSLP